MEIPVTQTKIVPPRRRANLITRGRLVEALYDALDYQLFVISAPAGYGKTSLLIDFASQTEMPVCWYSLEALDQDPLQFTAHFIASIALRFPGFGEPSRRMLQGFREGTFDLRRLISVIVNDIYRNIPEPIGLVLDDFHLVESSQPVVNFVNQFIQQAGDHFHLIVATRKLLALPDLSLMVARSQAGGLGYEDLAFRAQEIQALMLKNYGVTISEATADRLFEETEGWITALLLSAETMWQGMEDRVRTARSTGISLYEYLTEQVFDEHPVRVQQALLRTSLFDEFDAGLCQAVLEPILYPEGRDWYKFIDDLLQSNLFVQPLGGEQVSLRYHHLFQDYLQKRLAREFPGEGTLILRQLARVYTTRKNWDKAFSIYQRIGEVEAIADFIEQAGLSMIHAGRNTILIRWLDHLPNEVLLSRPLLLALHGIARVNLGEVKSGLVLLNKAVDAFHQDDASGHLAMALTWRADASRFLGNYDSALMDTDEVLQLAGDGDLEAYQAGALRTKGLALQKLGRLEEAVHCLEQSLSIFTALGNAENAAAVRMGVGALYRAMGEYARAEDTYLQAVAHWRETDNPLMQADLLNNLGVLLHFRGDYEQAIAHFEDALRCAERSGDARVEAFTLTSIGDVYRDLEATEAALGSYRRAYKTAIEIKHQFLCLYLELAHCAVSRLQGNLAEADTCLAKASERIHSDSSSYEHGLYEYEVGQVSLARGECGEAIAHFKVAEQRFGESRQPAETMRTLIRLAITHDCSGETVAGLCSLKRALHMSLDLESLSPLIPEAREGKALLERIQDDPEISYQASLLLSRVEQFERNLPVLRRRLRHEHLTVSFEPPKLEFCALGQVQASLHQEALTNWEAQVAQDLLFCLLAHPNGLTKEQIGAIFWPECSAGQLRVRFKKTIYRLRRAAGQEVVVFEQDRYRINRELDYAYDVETFTIKLAQARQETDPDRRAKAMQAALEVYKGAYLPCVDWEWVLPERERLWQAFASAALELARYYLENKDYDGVMHYCNRVLGEDRYNEEAYRLAMRVCAALGDQAGILRQYETCKRLLWEDLGVSPSTQTTQLFEMLKR